MSGPVRTLLVGPAFSSSLIISHRSSRFLLVNLHLEIFCVPYNSEPNSSSDVYTLQVLFRV